jgi:hypothetical protein
MPSMAFHSSAFLLALVLVGSGSALAPLGASAQSRPPLGPRVEWVVIYPPGYPGPNAGSPRTVMREKQNAPSLGRGDEIYIYRDPDTGVDITSQFVELSIVKNGRFQSPRAQLKPGFEVRPAAAPPLPLELKEAPARTAPAAESAPGTGAATKGLTGPVQPQAAAADPQAPKAASGATASNPPASSTDTSTDPVTSDDFNLPADNSIGSVRGKAYNRTRGSSQPAGQVQNTGSPDSDAGASTAGAPAAGAPAAGAPAPAAAPAAPAAPPPPTPPTPEQKRNYAQEQVQKAEAKYNSAVAQYGLGDGNDGPAPDQVQTAAKSLASARTNLAQKQSEYDATMGNPTAPEATPNADEIIQESRQQKEARAKEELAKKEEAALGRVQGKIGNAKGYQRDNSDLSTTSEDRCAIGSTVDEKYQCAGTEKLVEGASAFNQASQALGALSTQVLGQVETQKAARQNNQAAFIESGARIQETTGKMQVSIGAINTVLSLAQMYSASERKDLAKKAKGIGSGEINTAGKNELKNQGITDQDFKANLSDSGQVAGERGYVSGAAGSETDKAIKAFKLNEKGDLFTLNQGEIGQLSSSANSSSSTANQQAAQEAKAQALELRSDGVRKKEAHVRSMLETASSRATSEQAAVGKEASAGALTSLIAGATNLIQGSFALKASKELKKAAGDLKNAQSLAAPVEIPDLDKPMFQPSQGGINTPAITGSGRIADEQQSFAQADEEQDDTSSLGEGFNPGGPDPGAFPSPPPASQVAGGGEGLVNGSGSVGGGGTGGGEAEGAEEPKAEYAANLNDPGSRYMNGGGGYTGGGGGGGEGGGGGPDLSGILDKLMGRNGEADFQGKPSLDEFGRSPASQGSYSLLDRGVNIFDRIHQAYQTRSRKGRI